MPEDSTIKEFVTALQTRESKTTRALTKFFTRSGRHSNRFPGLRQQGRLNVLSPIARRELRAMGLQNRHITHINQWPKAQKEQVRNALLTAVNSNRNIRFFWELYGGSKEETEITDTGSGPIRIVFRSPQTNVRVSSAAATFGEVKVDVGPKRRPRPRARATPRRRPKR